MQFEFQIEIPARKTFEGPYPSLYHALEYLSGLGVEGEMMQDIANIASEASADVVGFMKRAGAMSEIHLVATELGQGLGEALGHQVTPQFVLRLLELWNQGSWK